MLEWIKKKIQNKKEVYNLNKNRNNAPKNLEECHEKLQELISKENERLLKTGKITTAHMHHGFGRWLRNNWGLWSGGPLREWFFERRVFHADDMSSIILDSYVARLKGKNFNFGAAQRKYERHWKKQGLDVDEEIEKLRQS